MSLSFVLKPDLQSDCEWNMLPPAWAVPHFAGTERQSMRGEAPGLGMGREHTDFNQYGGF